MSDTARDYQTIEPATTEGLEDLFDCDASRILHEGEEKLR
jgi:hypothetical protein